MDDAELSKALARQDGQTALALEALANKLEAFGLWENDGATEPIALALLEAAGISAESGVTVVASLLRSAVHNLDLKAQELAAYAEKLRSIARAHREEAVSCFEDTPPFGIDVKR